MGQDIAVLCFARVRIRSVLRFSLTLILALLLSPSTAAGDALPIGQLLDSVSRQSLEIRDDFGQMKLVDLPMSYREGRRLETYQRLALGSIERLAKTIPIAKRRPSLYRYYVVSIELRSLTSNLELYSDLLGDFSSSDQTAVTKASGWADAVGKRLDPLYAVMLDVEDLLYLAFEQADDAIATCKQP